MSDEENLELRRPLIHHASEHESTSGLRHDGVRSLDSASDLNDSSFILTCPSSDSDPEYSLSLGGTAHHPQKRRSQWTQHRRHVIVFLSILNLALLALYVHLRLSVRSELPQFRGAPDALKFREYRAIKFTSGFDDDRTIYQGPPNSENEFLWRQFRAYGILNTTFQLRSNDFSAPDIDSLQPGEQATQLSVFHHLHCLDILRRHLHNFYFSLDTGIPTTADSRAGHEAELWETAETIEDVDYCIEALRQALLCSVDTSVIVWRWKESLESQSGSGSRALPLASIWHTCVDWDVVLDWGKAHSFAAAVILNGVES